MSMEENVLQIVTECSNIGAFRVRNSRYKSSKGISAILEPTVVVCEEVINFFIIVDGEEVVDFLHSRKKIPLLKKYFYKKRYSKNMDCFTFGTLSSYP